MRSSSFCRRSFLVLFTLATFLYLYYYIDIDTNPPVILDATSKLLPVSESVHHRRKARGSVAVLYFGHVGAASNEMKSIADASGSSSFSMEAAIGCAPSIQKHVIQPALSQGWEVDKFIHSWSAEHEIELIKLLSPKRYLFGKTTSNAIEGLIASIEASLLLMKTYVTEVRNGVPYDSILLLRYDTMFFTPFNFSELVAKDSLYVASWCKAGDEISPPSTNDIVYKCFQLYPYWAGEEGVPDFWFAGSPKPLLTVFEGLYDGLADESIKPGRTCGGWCGHAKVWGGATARGIPLKRYLQHQIDTDLYRHKECGIKREQAVEGKMGITWGDKSSEKDNDINNGKSQESICGNGRFACALNSEEIEHCGLYFVQDRDW
jgi:hypothetical protein